jgi:hypothetical protein
MKNHVNESKNLSADYAAIVCAMNHQSSRRRGQSGQEGPVFAVFNARAVTIHLA